METYVQMKNRHQREFDDLPIFFAFSNEQFKKGMEKLGLTENDTHLIFKINGGGFYKKTDSHLLQSYLGRTNLEMKQAISEDTSGEGFIYQMFNYELSNYEYVVTGELEDTLDATGFTYEEIQNNPALKNGLDKAIANQNSNW